MPNATDLSSVPLYQIIGAPLLAIVQAESQAAQATANFIEQVGFDDNDEGVSRLKTFTFKYTKTGVGGDTIEFTVEIPVLSIVPIPIIEVREATIDFGVEVNEAVELEQKTTINPTETSGEDSSLEPNIVAFKAGLAKQSSSSAMKIHISAGQADTPVGLLTLFRVMEQGISTTSGKVTTVDAENSSGESDTTTTTEPS
ncbi:hypothetical protein AFK68_24105 [Hydrocoleum sp. CS-953]|uniref:DUF2589 domain-containing protein n=1 Tax=Hydrocoleum sp. CS-953 TaxID=1671698 RepID=UPI000B9A5DE2|nr:DUF2589 domain-containing protein [Hydrocoleum sp. CS-953]OZH52485.1 hypothetical protein AFK68_24105 [Hydrocoleum sp. CS-953]